MSKPSLIHLHTHSSFSTLDAISKIPDIVKRMKEYGHSAGFLSDHGTISGCIDFYFECKKVGIKPILGCLLGNQEIIIEGGIKEIKDISINDNVLTNRGRFRKVSSLMKRSFSGDLYNIKLSSSELKVTGEHPILIRDNKGNISWVKAKDIVGGRKNKTVGIKSWNSYVCLPKLEQENNYLSINTSDFIHDLKFINGFCTKVVKKTKYDSFKQWKDFPLKIILDEDFGYLLGLYTAEGWVNKNLNGTLGLSLNKAENNFANEFNRILKNTFNYELTKKEINDRKSLELFGCQMPIAYLLSSLCGIGAHNKFVHPLIFSSPQPVKDAYIKGLLDGDGKKASEKNKKGVQTLKVASRNLAWSFRQLIASSGFWSTVLIIKEKKGEKEYTSYSVSYSPNRIYSRSLEDSNYIFKPIKEVTKKYIENVDVFNFEVEEDNSYVSDFILHNCEAYFIPDHLKHKEDIKNKVASPGKRNYHLILMAMNAKGWENIKILNTKANEKFYYDPRVDYKDLEKYNEGVICSTACLKGIVPYNLSEGNFDEAAFHAGKLKSIFGDRFYLETQDGGLNIQPKINKAMRALGKHLDIKIMGAQDSHYIDRNDVEAHEAIWAIRTQDTLDKPVGDPKTGGRMYYSTREYWLKDAEHMLYEEMTTEDGEKRLGTVTREELEMTLEIADRIENVEIDTSMKLPSYEYIPDIHSKGCAAAESKCDGHSHSTNRALSYLIELVRNGYEEKYGRKFYEATSEHKERIEKELRDIETANLSDYFLIIWDILKWARDNNIATGPGRGSVGGSCVAYCLSITEIDPFLYGLIWERFYNVGRVGSMADIDMDFSRRDRERVIEYVRGRYGEKRVAQMVTFNQLKPKAALKDVNKLLGSEGMSFDEANIMTKHVHFKAKTLKEALEGKEGSFSGSEELQEYEKKNPKLFRLAKALEGCAKSKGKHAAGVIIAKEDFDSGSTSLCWDTKKKMLITEFDGVTMEKMGFLKGDFLGLKSLDVLSDIVEDVNKRLDK